MGIENFFDRDEGKWSHPQYEDTYVSNEASFRLLEVFDYDTQEGLAYNEMAEKAIREVFPDFNPELTEHFEAPGCVEDPDAPLVDVWVRKPLKPRSNRKKLPCIFIIPGGGLALCSYQVSNLEEMSDRYGVITATVRYRTIFHGDGYPDTINDCHAAYQFLIDHAEELGIDTKKIVLHGGSSGGHLCLALCHRLKKYDIAKPCGCIVWSPIVDDRQIYPSSNFVSANWGVREAEASNRRYLGKLSGNHDVPADAYPGRATVEECVGLPPTFIHSFMNDSAVDAAMAYISKLNMAGVYAQIHCWGGTMHSTLQTYANFSKDDPEATEARIYLAMMEQEFNNVLDYDLTRPWTVEEFNA